MNMIIYCWKNINIEKNKFMREKINEEERMKAKKEFVVKESFL